MLMTADNLNEVMFENEDARLLLLDVVSHTTARLYYYHNREITTSQALRIWHKAMAVDGYSVSFLTPSAYAGISGRTPGAAGSLKPALERPYIPSYKDTVRSL